MYSNLKPNNPKVECIAKIEVKLIKTIFLNFILSEF